MIDRPFMGWRWVFATTLTLILMAPQAGAETRPPQAPSRVERTTATIPFKKEAEPSAPGIGIRVIAVFVFVLILAFALVYAVKRWFPQLYVHRATSGQLIHVQESRRLTPRLTLFVVDFEGSRLLLAQSGDQVINLSQRPAPADTFASHESKTT